MTSADLIAFESRIAARWEAGELPTLLHLCGGNEDKLLAIFATIRPWDWVFSTHRNHYHALLKGIPEERVFAEIMAGNSMFMFSREHNFFTSAILASCTGIAAGVAENIQRTGGGAHVYCFLGDGAEEQGHFYEAALFAEAHDLPITFIIEDNNRQVDTPRAARRGPERLEFYGDADGVPSGANNPLDHFKCVHRYHYTPTYPHAGSGCKHQITFKPEAIERLRAEATK